MSLRLGIYEYPSEFPWLLAFILFIYFGGGPNGGNSRPSAQEGSRDRFCASFIDTGLFSRKMILFCALHHKHLGIPQRVMAFQRKDSIEACNLYVCFLCELNGRPLVNMYPVP